MDLEVSPGWMGKGVDDSIVLVLNGLAVDNACMVLVKGEIPNNF